MAGFAFFHFPENIGPVGTELRAWLDDGSLVMDEEILEGIERYPEFPFRLFFCHARGLFDGWHQSYSGLTPAEIVAVGPDAASVSGDAGCKLDCRPLKNP
jgi:hypothetical protein